MSFSRRDFLVRSAFLALGGPAFLAACSSDKKSPDTTPDTSSDTTAAASGSGSGKVRIATWPLYIEDDQLWNLSVFGRYLDAMVLAIGQSDG